MLHTFSWLCQNHRLLTESPCFEHFLRCAVTWDLDQTEEVRSSLSKMYTVQAGYHSEVY